MNMTQPTVRRFPAPPASTDRDHTWRAAAGLSLVVTALGTLVGSTLSAFVGTDGLGWQWAEPVLTPLTALVAAASVYGHYRHLPLDWLQARMARVLVFTGGTMMLAAVVLARPAMAGVALWFMTGSTVIVTTLAAGAGASDEIQGSLPWAHSA